MNWQKHNLISEAVDEADGHSNFLPSVKALRNQFETGPKHVSSKPCVTSSIHKDVRRVASHNPTNNSEKSMQNGHNYRNSTSSNNSSLNRPHHTSTSSESDTSSPTNSISRRKLLSNITPCNDNNSNINSTVANIKPVLNNNNSANFKKVPASAVSSLSSLNASSYGRGSEENLLTDYDDTETIDDEDEIEEPVEPIFCQFENLTIDKPIKNKMINMNWDPVSENFVFLFGKI